MLQLTTPRGGQYQAVLPDGTKIWLNAASSIRFPSKFDGNERGVEITGEAYLEVAKNTRQPFIVHTSKTVIEVLGTSFNVNAYSDEEAVKTTLIEGSVKVKTTEKEAILKPGQQAAVDHDSHLISLINGSDIDQALAWKRRFRFTLIGQIFRLLLRQLARWYDVEVVYERGIPNVKFGGEMQRDLKLPQC